MSLQGCGARIVTEGTGVLTSPNYPHSWEEGGECDWVIVGARPCECMLEKVGGVFLFQLHHLQ